MEEKELFATAFDEYVAHNNPQDELEGYKAELEYFKSKYKQLLKENTDLKNLKVCNSCGDWNDDVHACQMYVRQEELYELTHENEKLKNIIADCYFQAHSEFTDELEKSIEDLLGKDFIEEMHK